MSLTLLSVQAENFTLFDGLVVAATGILTVLAILFLISVCISVSAKIIYFAEHKGERKIIRKKTVRTEAPKPVSAPEPEPVITAEEPAQDEGELVAAITAAIAASLNTSPDRLVVRSFRRPQNWQSEALQEQINHSSFKTGL
ncbi:MAG: OadG family protein [Clostridiales bacterium]|nr:OadG family protein [Clostridiales bacterium]